MAVYAALRPIYPSSLRYHTPENILELPIDALLHIHNTQDYKSIWAVRKAKYPRLQFEN